MSRWDICNPEFAPPPAMGIGMVAKASPGLRGVCDVLWDDDDGRRIAAKSVHIPLPMSDAYPTRLRIRRRTPSEGAIFLPE
jgi:hypothetical protein